MRGSVLVIAFLIASSFLMFARSHPVRAQSTTKYEIQLAPDGSATWIIEETGTNLNSSLDTLLAFRSQIATIVDAAQNVTGRQMSAPDDAMSMTSAISGSYVTVKYMFLWTNFSSVTDHAILVGDVFNAPDLFNELFGDGETQLTYPPDFGLRSISPQPKQQDDSLHTITWAGTIDFAPDSVRLLFSQEAATSSLPDFFSQYGILTVGIAVAAITGSSVFYILRLRRKREPRSQEFSSLNHPTIETDEDKIQNLLRSSGGMMYQSAIVEECKFSKAKTSLLLATLEERGIIARERRGRDKVVVSVQGEEEKRDNRAT